MTRVVYILVFVLTMVSLALGAGLRTTFVKVTLENLRIGNTYNIREMANLPLAVYNTGDQPVDLKIEATIPIEGELREGYEPIPDLSWILVKQDSFGDIEPGAVAMTDVLVSIPDSEEYLGRRYQAMIWSHTIGQGFIACGLKSEVLFSVSKSRDEAEEMLSVFPNQIYVTDVKAGEVFDLKEKGGGLTLKVFNLSEKAKEFQIESIKPTDSPLESDEGYADCPNPRFLILSDRTFTLPASGQKEIEVYVAFPRGEEYTGKKYMFIIRTRVISEPESGVYSKVYVSLKA